MTIPDIYGASEVLADAIVAHVSMPPFMHLASIDFHYGYSDPNCTEPNWSYTFVVTHEHGTEIPLVERDVDAERIRIIETFLYKVDNLTMDSDTYADLPDDEEVEVDTPVAQALSSNPDNLDLEDDWRKKWLKNHPNPHKGV